MEFNNSNTDSEVLEGGTATTLSNGVVRKICKVCNTRLGTKSYKKRVDGSKYIYYRSKCQTCQQKNKEKYAFDNRLRCKDRYLKKGYDYSNNIESKKKSRVWINYKKSICEKCGFIPEHSCQLDVDHIDGNKQNNDPSNFQTLCSNCHRLKTHINNEYYGHRRRLHKVTIKTVEKIMEFNNGI